MAIAPLQMLDNGQTSLQQLLTRGGNVLAQSLQNSINLGRSLADNQIRQEQDFLREQRSEINLLERRGERAQAQANLDRNFNQGVYQFDRTADRADQATQFSQGQQLFQNELSLGAASRADQQAATSQQLADVRLSEADRIAREREDQRLFTRGVAGSNFLSEVDGATPEQKAAISTAQAAAARESNDVEGFLGATSAAAAAEAELTKAKRVNPILTPAEQRMRRNELRSVEREDVAQAEKEAKRLIANTDAFPPPSSFYFAEREKARQAAGTDTKAQEAAVAAFESANGAQGNSAQVLDKDRFSYESQAATSRDRDAYINASGNPSITEAQKTARGKFWDKVNATGGAETTAPAAPAAQSPLDWLRSRTQSLK